MVYSLMIKRESYIKATCSNEINIQQFALSVLITSKIIPFGVSAKQCLNNRFGLFFNIKDMYLITIIAVLLLTWMFEMLKSSKP